MPKNNFCVVESGSVQLPLYEDESGKRVINKIKHREEAQKTCIVWRK